MSKPLFIFCLAVVLDQVSKSFARQSGNALLNSGISFSFLTSLPAVVLTLVIAAGIILLYSTFKNYWHLHPTLAALFFAGALSNLLDRIVYNGVVDWLPIPGLAIHNNLADWYIAVAVIGIAMKMKKS